MTMQELIRHTAVNYNVYIHKACHIGLTDIERRYMDDAYTELAAMERLLKSMGYDVEISTQIVDAGVVEISTQIVNAYEVLITSIKINDEVIYVR